MSSFPKVVFVSHDASMTGAPIVLLSIIKEFKRITNFPITVICRRGGDLFPGFQEIVPTFLFYNPYRKISFSVLGINISFPVFSLKVHSIRRDLNRRIRNADIIFCNTIVALKFLTQVDCSGKRVFAYIHELSIVSRVFGKESDMELVKKLAEKIFVPSKAVKEFLVDEYQIESDRIELLHHIFPYFSSWSLNSKTKDQHFTLGFCATSTLVKGFDIVPLLIKRISEIDDLDHYKFFWIGANLNSLEFEVVKEDLTKLNLIRYMEFLGKTDKLPDYFNAMDLFVLPSREDPFPLVVFEAAHFELPTVYFNKGGGIGEFLGSDAGVPVGYLDVEQMATAIVRLRKNPDELRQLGKTAKTKLTAYLEVNPAVQLQKFFE
jgi:glycosyltransferase involved in cell wall biosynthesis